MYRITSVDVHVAGEPLRVITSGFPDLPGDTILEKRRVAREQFDHLRTALMLEPRGHPNMYGCVLVPPVNPQADLGVLFMHNEGYSTMCGHGIIGLTTVVLDRRILPLSEPESVITLETPSGLVTARACVKAKRVRSVGFMNVPSFVLTLDQCVEVPGVGRVRYDLAFGGAFYAFCNAEELGVELNPESARDLVEIGMRIKCAVAAAREVQHPLEEDLSFLYGAIFVGLPKGQNAQYRQVCIFADGALDRSPTGTGVSAHLAILHARKQVDLHQAVRFESILGTQFVGRIHEAGEYAGHASIIPEVEGTAYLTGEHEFVIEDEDPLRTGFLLR